MDSEIKEMAMCSLAARNIVKGRLKGYLEMSLMTLLFHLKIKKQKGDTEEGICRSNLA